MERPLLTIPDIIAELKKEVDFIKKQNRVLDKEYDQNEIWHNSGYIDGLGLALSRLSQLVTEQENLKQYRNHK